MLKPVLGVIFVLLAALAPAQNQTATATLPLIVYQAPTVVLTWTASTTAGVTQYDIYMSTAGGPYSLVATVDAPTCTTTLTGPQFVPGTTYDFVATAVLANGLASGDSNTASVTIP